MDNKYIKWFESVRSDDVSQVGGKNASLGEMIHSLKKHNVRVPGGFATTAQAYRDYLNASGIEKKLKSLLDDLDMNTNLEKTGKAIRKLFHNRPFPDELVEAIEKAYNELCEKYKDDVDVAVRSSATAEDLPEASFAGQQETFLNITGADEVLEACRKCYASLFTDRAIAYREEKGFDHLKVALSVGVQKMVRSDKAGSGVMFSIDTETGFPDVVVINAAWGLGENVVQGAVNPDEYRIFKPLLSGKKQYAPIIEKSMGEKEKKMVYATGGSRTTKNQDTAKNERNGFVLDNGEILQLARMSVTIEDLYKKPMDIEWAKDGETGELFIVQARPETVQSQKEARTINTFTLKEKGEKLVSGIAIGEAIAGGKTQIIKDTDDMDRFEKDAILVTGMTDPDWVPVMKKAAGIVTDYGGRTSHAAIVSRELGIPAVVGAGNATEEINDGEMVTLSCAEGDQGYIYKGELDFEKSQMDLDVPDTKTRIMMNIASPAAAFRWWRLPCRGIGLARMEFIINNIIKIHPMALLRFNDLEDDQARRRIKSLTRGYDNLPDYFIDHLARGIAKIAAAQYPDDVIVRLSDFKTNEYAGLIGGGQFEPAEDNPMLGFRGASRYYSDQYRPGFDLECRAIKKAREDIGLHNIIIMVPFCRTIDEADKVLEVMAENGLERSKNKNGLKVYVMCEIPSNIVLAEQFAKRFDGFSIGSNDLTQLVLGVDRDSAELAHLFDEKNQTVKNVIQDLIAVAHEHETKVGICGQAPSDHPDFAAFLVEKGIDSISLNPDSIIGVKKRVAEIESENSK